MVFLQLKLFFTINFRALASALEVIPRTLAQNCGANTIRTLTTLRAKHAEGNNSTFGVNGLSGKIEDMKQLGIYEPLAVKLQVYKTAVETAILLLRIDDIVSGSKKKDDGAGGPTSAPMPEWKPTFLWIICPWYSILLLYQNNWLICTTTKCLVLNTLILLNKVQCFSQQMPGYYFNQKSLGYQPGFFLISNQFTLTKAKILTFLTWKVVHITLWFVTESFAQFRNNSQSYIVKLLMSKKLKLRLFL